MRGVGAMMGVGVLMVGVPTVGVPTVGGCFPPPHLPDAAEVGAPEVAEEVQAEVPAEAVEVGSEVDGAPDTAECDRPEDRGRLAGVCRKLLCIHGTCATEPDTGAACDDGAACTKADTCDGYVCRGSAYACDDGVACTDDVCDGSGGCGYPAKVGWCHIGAACVAAGTAKADDPCRVCTGGEAWSANDGAVCDDGDACTIGDRCDGTVCEPGPPPDDSVGDWATMIATGQFDTNTLPIAARSDGGVHVAARLRDGDLLGTSVGNQWRTFELALNATGHLPAAASWSDEIPPGVRLGVSAISGSLDALWGFTFGVSATLHWSQAELPLDADVSTTANAVIVRTSGDASEPPLAFYWRALTGGAGGKPSAILFGLQGLGARTCATLMYRDSSISGPALDPPLPATDVPLGVMASLESDGHARWAVASVLLGVPLVRRASPGCVLVGGALRDGQIPMVNASVAVSQGPSIAAYWWNDDAKVERRHRCSSPMLARTYGLSSSAQPPMTDWSRPSG